MRVKIKQATSASSWYKKYIGETFEVISEDSYRYKINTPIRDGLVFKSNCEVIEDTVQYFEVEGQSIMLAISNDVERAEQLHPNYPTDNFKRLAILMEEAGEVAKEVNDIEWKDKSTEDLKTELIQTAAMCIRFLKALEQ